MTAIAAFWTPGSLHGNGQRCAAMLAAQHHYGPDDRAIATSGGAALGRNLYRLLPEDVHDQQPLIGAGGDLMMVADVRLDAREELAATLGIAAIDAKGKADAAILLAAWERWGPVALERLIGAFAFAVFDRRSASLTLARDLHGERPLFWHRARDFVAVASMPNGITALPDVLCAPDLVRVERLLSFLPSPGPRSFYEGINRVEPGQVVTLTATGAIVRRYRELEPRNLGLRRFNDYVDAYREQLDNATRSRLRGANGKVAAHLSGGWDSSAVVGTAARLLAPEGGRVVAFTSVPRPGTEADCPSHRFADESGHAAAAAAMHKNVEHVLVPGTGRSPIADLDQYLAVYTRPMLNLCNHVWLSDIRRRAHAGGMKVLLTGELGNYTISSAPAELLSDYLRRGEWGGWARESWGALRNRRARLRGVLASSFSPWLPLPLWRKLQVLAANAPMEASLLLHPDRIAGALAEHTTARLRRRTMDVTAATVATLNQLDAAEHRKGMLGGWGVDERDPTADVRVIEFMLSLPPDMFLKNGRRRPLARSALADRVPEVILAERRKGHQAIDWHQGLTADKDQVHALVERIGAHPTASALIDVPELRRMLHDWPSGNWDQPLIYSRYRRGLMFTLSAGHFLVST